MNTSERYISTHHRSLLISRFQYSKSVNLARVRSCKILALVPPSHYEPVTATVFVGTGIWPNSKLFVKKKKKKRWEIFFVNACSSYIKTLANFR